MERLTVVDPQPPGRIRDIRVYRPSFVGMALLACTPFLIFGAASVYGLTGTIVLGLIWLLLFAVGCRYFMASPPRVAAVGVLSLVAWFVVVLIAKAG